MKKLAIIVLFLIIVGFTGPASGSKLSVPALEKGDILLCDEYPFRTVKNTSRTVYQLTRLGYHNVSSFQEAHGLKADGVIGRETRQKAESEFNKQFNMSPQTYTDLKMFSLSVNPELTDSNIAVTVTMRNDTDNPLRLAGSITYDSDGNFLFKAPTLSFNKKFSIRKDGRLSCGFGPWTEVIICAGGTIIGPLKHISATTSLPKLEASESGLITIETGYIDSTISTGIANAMGVIPGSEVENGISIYFKPGTLEISNIDLDTLLKNVNKTKYVKIEGYTCKGDKGSDVELFAVAHRRAEAVAKVLIDNGFPVKNITTVAYGESEECKAVVIEIDNQQGDMINKQLPIQPNLSNHLIRKKIFSSV